MFKGQVAPFQAYQDFGSNMLRTIPGTPSKIVQRQISCHLPAVLQSSGTKMYYQKKGATCPLNDCSII